MGTASSSNLQNGVLINPRVNYAHTRSKKQNKMMRIDAPALVQLKHGTVRYRFDGSEVKNTRRERPHEGLKDLHSKQGYFYHHKHNFTSDEGQSPEDSWKYCHVYKGPERAKQKKLYYVYGRGLNVNGDGFVQCGYKPEEQSFQRPIFYKVAGHVYLDVIFLKRDPQTADVEEDEEEFPTKKKDPLYRDEDEDPVDQLQDMEVKLSASTKVIEVKQRLAKKLVKPVTHIHLYTHGTELKHDQTLRDLTTIEEIQTELSLLLHPK